MSGFLFKSGKAQLLLLISRKLLEKLCIANHAIAYRLIYFCRVHPLYLDFQIIIASWRLYFCVKHWWGKCVLIPTSIVGVELIRSASVIKDLLTCILRIEGAIVMHGKSFGFIEYQEVLSLYFVQWSADKRPRFNFSDVISVTVNIFLLLSLILCNFNLKI